MAEIYVDQTSPIKTKIFFGGEIRDADGDVDVVVFDITEDKLAAPLIDPGSPVYETVALKSEVDAGTYYFVLPAGMTRRTRKFKIEWSYSVDNNQSFHTTYTDVVTPYVSLLEVMEDLNYGTDPSDFNYKSYHDLQMAEKYARKTIENYTGQSFYLYDDTHIVYGDGADSLRLPFKINQIHELYENDILLLDTINNINNWNYDVQVSESGFGIRVNKANMLDNTVYTSNGMVPPTINDTSGQGVFGKRSVYRIQGRYGWDYVPDEVEEAAIHLIRDYFSKDRLWRQKYIHSVQSFDWHFEYNTGAFIGTGNLYVDQILLPYVLTQMVVI